MPLDKSTLINFLTALDKEISREITLVAVGGTAMRFRTIQRSLNMTDPDITPNTTCHF